MRTVVITGDAWLLYIFNRHTMYALTCSAGKLSLNKNAARPELNPAEALIKVTLAGICSTDLEIVQGYAGFDGILGHEFVGIVEQVADKKHHNWVGQRVVGSINIACMQCCVCIQQGPEHCQHRKVLGIRGKHGCFAEYISLPIANLLAVPDSVADESAVFTEPLAAACRIREQLTFKGRDKIAVVGPGKLGLLVASTIAISGYDVTVLGRKQHSLTLAAQWNLSTGFVSEYEQNSFDIVIEASGNSAGFEYSLGLVKPLGTLVLKSTFQNKHALDLSKVVVAEINVLGSRCGAFAPALKILEQQLIPVQATIDAEFALQDAIAAMQYASKPGVRKVILRV